MEDRKIKYYRLCEEAKEYGEEFFKELCVSCSNPTIIKDDILPLVFEDIKDLQVYGRLTTYNKQASILIGIDDRRIKLILETKKTIRHEIIHYFLWLQDLPYEDDSLLFWCLSYMYDGGAYSKLQKSDKEKYNLFKSECDSIREEYSNIHKSFIEKNIFGIAYDIFKEIDFEIARKKARKNLDDLKKYF